jgi:hypothetical protein
VVRGSGWFHGDYHDYVEVPRDERDDEARQSIVELVERNKNGVWFSRQIEVLLEDKFFHWITNRVVRELV